MVGRIFLKDNVEFGLKESSWARLPEVSFTSLTTVDNNLILFFFFLMSGFICIYEAGRASQVALVVKNPSANAGDFGNMG